MLLPPVQTLPWGETLDFSRFFPELPGPVSVSIGGGENPFLFDGGLSLNGKREEIVIRQPGEVNLQFLLFGVVPFKKVRVEVIRPVEVIPGGQAIGIVLTNKGLVIASFTPVEQGGRTYYPAREAGLAVGDVIFQANGRPVGSQEEFAHLVDQVGREQRTLKLGVQRGREKFFVRVRPLYCARTGRYRLGVYVREQTAGLGTLTFYVPALKVYGALGHLVVLDSEGEKGVDLRGARIVKAQVEGIRPGRRGQPGEKVGTFSGKSFWGEIRENTDFGIFGKLTGPFANPFYPQPVPVAFASQVKPGKAEVLTVLAGDKIERFEVEIERVFPQQGNGRNLALRVTDPRLLTQAGGIVQGMSGSPLLQDGRLVGAVTHVFVDDLARGYGVLAEEMLRAAGILKVEGTSQKVANF